MIEKAKLEELIKNKQPIYYKSVAVLYPHKWKYGYDIPDKLNCLYKKPLNKLTWYELEDLFATKEEKDWHYEFGNITRTETLTLPSWEEITNKIEEGKPFKMYFNNEQFLFVSRLIVKVGKYDTYDIEIEPYFCEGTTKENYIKACRLVKKLFFGRKR